jgi:hypothetical protein
MTLTTMLSAAASHNSLNRQAVCCLSSINQTALCHNSTQTVRYNHNNQTGCCLVTAVKTAALQDRLCQAACRITAVETAVHHDRLNQTACQITAVKTAVHHDRLNQTACQIKAVRLAMLCQSSDHRAAVRHNNRQAVPYLNSGHRAAVRHNHPQRTACQLRAVRDRCPQPGAIPLSCPFVISESLGPAWTIYHQSGEKDNLH